MRALDARCIIAHGACRASNQLVKFCNDLIAQNPPAAESRKPKKEAVSGSVWRPGVGVVCPRVAVFVTVCL
jgi:hypothetical protein